MNQKTKKRKKRKQRHHGSEAQRLVAAGPFGDARPAPAGEDEQTRIIISALVEAFGSISVDEAAAAFREADGNPNRAVEILRVGLLDGAEEPSTSSNSSGASASESGFASSSVSGSSEGYVEANFMQDALREKRVRGNKAKKLVAATGTVSTVLGKEYLKVSSARDSARLNGFLNGGIVYGKEEETEQFLCAMLGEESELSLAVVRDVLCQCGYNVGKALDVLLDLSASSCEQSRNCINLVTDVESREDTRSSLECSENYADRLSDCTSQSYESEPHENPWFISSECRNHFDVPSGRSIESNVSQEVLECLYKISKSPQHEPRTMNWRHVAKKMNTFGNELESHEETIARGDEYTVLRKDAEQHWESMKSSYQKAAVAYSKGAKGYAAVLSEEGKKYSKMGRQAEERASQEIFRARNKNIENVITIDLHGQHVKQAMRLLKFHLLLPSIQKLKVITGCGSHGVGKSKLKQSVVRLIEREGIEWSEENQGMVVIKLDQRRNFSFVDADSDSD
ncbi:SMR domain-containing protein At5g58720 isoform X1 [Syzygium oleosum]|uniref:SMR domain-containing protein At5g58720 isoform X1 n=1 Tax=Syzygium oleosum TaxID=219896 RepID=UPI0011D24953|nr:SMR domain-containing protein At5g58720 isoform X1 [Syzygium oleosum]